MDIENEEVESNEVPFLSLFSKKAITMSVEEAKKMRKESKWHVVVIEGVVARHFCMQDGKTCLVDEAFGF